MHELTLTDGGTTYLTMATTTKHTMTLSSIVNSDLGPHEAKLRSYFVYPPDNIEVSSSFEVFTVTIDPPCDMTALLTSTIPLQVHPIGTTPLAYVFDEV